MHLSPTVLEAAYTYLRATPPFNRWKLPEADDLGFVVSVSTSDYGIFQYVTKTHEPQRIAISCKLVKTTEHLMATMAHEMVHLHQRTTECSSRVTAEHGRKFKAAAERVIRQHGFSRHLFNI